MGTDIHTVWQAENADGTWTDIEHDYDEHRHYRLFAILAGVRNGRGFAGVVTGEAVKPIDRPRGYPEDFDVDDNLHYTNVFSSHEQEWRKTNPECYTPPHFKDMGDHNHSWLLGDEILAWASRPKTAIAAGILDRDVYETWDGKQPNSWCGGISGPNVVLINDTEKERTSAPHWTHIRVTWEEDLVGQVQYFLDEVRKQVEKHGNIRIVFGFDS